MRIASHAHSWHAVLALAQHVCVWWWFRESAIACFTQNYTGLAGWNMGRDLMPGPNVVPWVNQGEHRTSK